jgi:hypothetical protein
VRWSEACALFSRTLAFEAAAGIRRPCGPERSGVRPEAAHLATPTWQDESDPGPRGILTLGPAAGQPQIQIQLSANPTLTGASRLARSLL